MCEDLNVDWSFTCSMLSVVLVQRASILGVVVFSVLFALFHWVVPCFTNIARPCGLQVFGGLFLFRFCACFKCGCVYFECTVCMCLFSPVARGRRSGLTICVGVAGGVGRFATSCRVCLSVL